MPDAQRVKKLFKGAAPRYNFVNTVLSLGLDSHWRQACGQAVAATGAVDIADVATGSGVLAMAVAQCYERQKKPYRITGIDFCPELLEIARQACWKKAWQGKIAWMEGDALSLPLEDASVDAITIGFGLRNFEDRAKAYEQMRRVLRPGGWVFILEFSQPVGLMRPLYRMYDNLLPTVAGWLGQDRSSYQYLKDSVRAFPDAAALAQELKEAGLTDVSWRRLTGGVVALHRARRLP